MSKSLKIYSSDRNLSWWENATGKITFKLKSQDIEYDYVIIESIKTLINVKFIFDYRGRSGFSEQAYYRNANYGNLILFLEQK